MNCFKRFTIVLVLLILPFSFSLAEDNRIAPAWPVPDYAEHLIQVASEEVGYTEDHGRTKYGAWAGDPAAQWCAEFLCWCVDQVDQRWGTALLRNVYPFYTSSNTGRNFFIRAGRYVVRKGRVDGWGYQWMKGKDTFIQSGDYVPQPGDWVFFNWGGGTDTEHVALVEYCTEDRGGNDFKERMRCRGHLRNPDRKRLNVPSAGECEAHLVQQARYAGGTPAGWIIECRRTTVPTLRIGERHTSSNPGGECGNRQSDFAY